jgi:hypothetical protein
MNNPTRSASWHWPVSGAQKSPWSKFCETIRMVPGAGDVVVDVVVDVVGVVVVGVVVGDVVVGDVVVVVDVAGVVVDVAVAADVVTAVEGAPVATDDPVAAASRSESEEHAASINVTASTHSARARRTVLSRSRSGIVRSSSTAELLPLRVGARPWTW